MGAVVLAFDALAAIASRLLGFPYGWASIGSAFLYAASGYLAARAERQTASGAMAGALVGVVDAVLGSWIANAIGPHLPAGAAPGNVAEFVAMVVVVMLLGTCFGAAGGIVGKKKAASEHSPG